MKVHKSSEFIADVEQQFEWYAVNAGWEIAERYLAAVQATCQFLGQYPNVGPRVGFNHPSLQYLRFFVVFRPFKKHVLFYEVTDKNVVMRRAMHGSRNLPGRLLDPPRTE